VPPPSGATLQPAHVTTLAASNWFEQDNWYSFGSSAPPPR